MILKVILVFFINFFLSILIPGLSINYLFYKKKLFSQKIMPSLFFIRSILIGIIYNYLLFIIVVLLASFFNFSLRQIYFFRIADIFFLFLLFFNKKEIFFLIKRILKKRISIIDLILIFGSILLGIITIVNAPQAVAGDQLYWTNQLILSNQKINFHYLFNSCSAGEFGYSALLLSPYVFIGHLHLFAIASGYKILLFLLLALMSIYFAESLSNSQKSIDLSIYKLLCFFIISFSFVGIYGISQTAKPTVFGILFNIIYFLSLITVIKEQKIESIIDAMIFLTCAISFGTITIPYIIVFTFLFFIGNVKIKKIFFLSYFIVFLGNIFLVIFSLISLRLAIVTFILGSLFYLIFWLILNKNYKFWRYFEGKYLYIFLILFFLTFVLFNSSNSIVSFMKNANFMDMVVNVSGLPYVFSLLGFVAGLYMSVFMKKSIEKIFFICLIFSLMLINFFIVNYYVICDWLGIKNIDNILGNNTISLLQVFVSLIRWYLPIIICFLVLNLLSLIFVNFSYYKKIILFLILVIVIVQNNMINIREFRYSAYTNSICGHKNSDIADFIEILFKLKEPARIIFIKPEKNSATNLYNIKLLDYFCYMDPQNKSIAKEYQKNYGFYIANENNNNDKVIYHYLNYINSDINPHPTYNVYEYSDPRLAKKIQDGCPALVIIDESNMSLLAEIRVKYYFKQFYLIKYLKNVGCYVFFVR